MKQIILILILTLFFYFKPLNAYSFTDNTTHNYKESYYVNTYCTGQIEYVLSDRTRVDCLTDEYAIEFDWAEKWAESIGQALYYAAMTNRKPAVAIIMKKKEDEKYIKRIIKANKNIVIFRLQAY